MAIKVTSALGDEQLDLLKAVEQMIMPNSLEIQVSPRNNVAACSLWLDVAGAGSFSVSSFQRLYGFTYHEKAGEEGEYCGSIEEAALDLMGKLIERERDLLAIFMEIENAITCMVGKKR